MSCSTYSAIRSIDGDHTIALQPHVLRGCANHHAVLVTVQRAMRRLMPVPGMAVAVSNLISSALDGGDELIVDVARLRRSERALPA
jgi:hypothetical protein